MEKFLKRIKLFLFFLSRLPNLRRKKAFNSHTLIVTSYSKELISQIDKLSEKLTDILFVNRSLHEFFSNEETFLIQKTAEKYNISIFLGDPIWFKEESWLERHKKTWEKANGKFHFCVSLPKNFRLCIQSSIHIYVFR